MSKRLSPVAIVLLVLCAHGATHVLAQAPLDKAWSMLRAGLGTKDDDQRAATVKVLGLLVNNPQAAELALKALKDKEPEVRAAAAGALGRMNAASAASDLEQAMNTDKEVSVVMAAARALIALGRPLGYSVPYSVLTGETKSGGGLLDEQKQMLSDPKKLAKLGFEQGMGLVPFSGVTLGAVKALTKDDASPIRAAAAKILARDPDPKSGDALVAAASDKSWIVRAAALDALSDRGDPGVLPKIERSLGDEKDVVRLIAAATLIHLHDVQTKEPR